jgi:hypothetical protein
MVLYADISSATYKFVSINAPQKTSKPASRDETVQQKKDAKSASSTGIQPKVERKVAEDINLFILDPGQMMVGE